MSQNKMVDPDTKRHQKEKQLARNQKRKFEER